MKMSRLQRYLLPFNHAFSPLIFSFFFILIHSLPHLNQYPSSPSRFLSSQPQSHPPSTAPPFALSLPLINHKNIYYYTFLSVGTPPQKQKFFLDTGSSLMYVTSNRCTTCVIPWNEYQIQNQQRFFYREGQSSTYQKYLRGNQQGTLQFQIQYGGGNVHGWLGEDLVQIGNFYVREHFGIVDRMSENKQEMVVDGIIGLDNDKSYKNIFQLAEEKGFISNSNFAFLLGVEQLKIQSVFYFNVTKEDFPSAIYLKPNKIKQWAIPMKGIEINSKLYQISETVIDTGTSFLVLPKSIYLQIFKTHFSSLCQPFNPNQKTLKMLKCDCQSLNSFPTLKIVISPELSLEMAPSMYLNQPFLQSGCTLGIWDGQSIMGMNFLQHFTTIFIKKQNMIGFVKNQRRIHTYIEGWICEWFEWVIMGLGIGIVFVGIWGGYEALGDWVGDYKAKGQDRLEEEKSGRQQDSKDIQMEVSIENSNNVRKQLTQKQGQV